MEIREWIGTLLGAISFVTGIVLWYRGAIEKSYASQRDFQHLRRNQEQLIENIKTIVDEIEEITHSAQANTVCLQELKQQIDFLNKTMIEQKSLLIVLARLPLDSEGK